MVTGDRQLQTITTYINDEDLHPEMKMKNLFLFYLQLHLFYVT